MTPRANVIKELSDECLKAMDNSAIEDVTPGEIMSACFTLCRHVTVVMIEQTQGYEKEHNRQEIINAIGSIYQIVAPPKEQVM